MEPRDLLKKLHTKQFSDSKIIDKIECPRELLDFHLSKLSEQNIHFDFEDFIKNIKDYKISILPMIVYNNEEIKPLWKYEIILKNVTVKQAYEIGKDDLEAAAILDNDNPIIPPQIKNPPINELLELKKLMNK